MSLLTDLAEAVALVRTLGWRVMGTAMLTVPKRTKANKGSRRLGRLFGQGQMARLSEVIGQHVKPARLDTHDDEEDDAHVEDDDDELEHADDELEMEAEPLGSLLAETSVTASERGKPAAAAVQPTATATNENGEAGGYRGEGHRALAVKRT